MLKLHTYQLTACLACGTELCMYNILCHLVQWMAFLDCLFPKLHLLGTHEYIDHDGHYLSNFLCADSYSLWWRSDFATSGGSKANVVHTNPTAKTL